MRTVAGSQLDLEHLGRSATPSRPRTSLSEFYGTTEAFRICEIGYFNRKTVGLDTCFRCVIELSSRTSIC